MKKDDRDHLKTPQPRTASAVDRIVGANLRALRLARGNALRDAGAAAGVSFQQMQKYENGSNRLALGTLLALRRYYGVPLAVLLGGLPEELAGQADDHEFRHALSTIRARLAHVNNPRTLDSVVRIVEILTE